MKYLIRGGVLFHGGVLSEKDILIEDGLVSSIRSRLSPFPGAGVYDMHNCFILPGLTDVHVHLREPGFSYKETIGAGTAAAARGGFTTVCAMPNLDPVPDSPAHMERQLALIRRDALIRVLPYASITAGEKQRALSDMAALASSAVAFSDDGVGVESGEMMEKAMRRAKRLGKLIAAHCEVASLTRGGAVHDGKFAAGHGLTGNPSESEWREVERDIALVRRTGCPLHICHVSAKESVALIRAAKAEGLPLSCETAPHYLVLCDEDLKDEGRFKMNPPIRGAEDREALLRGIADGTVDIVATDHAPHSEKEKSGGLAGSLNGVAGLETAFPVLYTALVKTGVITAEKLIGLMHTNPRRRFGAGGQLVAGLPAELTIFDMADSYVIDPADFLSKGRASPFAGKRVFGRCLLTMFNGKTVWEDKRFQNRYTGTGKQ
ncbi:MAG: dihydroorotase [Oscillospiraceae bacterium]|jgi:dihydroorotase|nr:dihydroorotase [Oscillospiraceae bacterium]